MIGILTKYFSPEWYGEYNKIYNYLSIFAFLADLGLYTLTIREISKDTTQASKIIGNMMSLRLILGIITLGIAFVIALFLPWYSSSATLWGIGIVAFFTIFNLLNSSVLSLMQSFMKIEFTLFSTIFSRVFQLLLTLAILFLVFPKSENMDFSQPFLWILAVGTLGAFINFVMNWYYACRFAKIQFLFDWEYMKKLFRESLPYGIALFLSVVYFKVDVVLLSLLEAPSVANHSIALYSLPMKIVEVLMVLGIFYLNSLLPSLSEFFHKNQTEKLKKLCEESLKILWSFGVFVFVGGMLFKEHILLLIATPEYLEVSLWYSSLDVFWVVLWVLVFYFISSLFSYILIAAKEEKKLLYVNIAVTVVNIVWNLIFIPKYSFLWAWYVTLASQIFLFWVLFFLSRNIFLFHIPWKHIGVIGIFWGIIWFFWNILLSTISFGLLWEFFLFGILFTLICGWGIGALHFLQNFLS